MNHISLIDLIDTQKDKTAFVCGTGPSLKQYLNRIKNKSESEILISCNDIDIMTDLVPDYWVFANSIQTIRSMKSRLHKYPTSYVVHADSVDTTPRSWSEQNIINPYVPYDQRHFNGQKCNNCPNGCSNFLQNRLTIQEILQQKFNSEKKYSTGCTVALHMLSLALILGCKKIYIMGVELNYSLGYVDGVSTNSDNFNLETIKSDFSTIRDLTLGQDIEIYNASPISELTNIFETVVDF